MPKINMRDYEEATASTGDYQRMGAGGYVAQIQAVRTDGPASYGKGRIDYVNSKEYVKLIYDMGAFKGNIQALDESNPGFDALAAFQADRWELFIGKKVGIVVGEEEYRGNDGTVKTRLGFPRLKSIQDIRAGKFKVPEPKKLKDDEQGYNAAPAKADVSESVYDEDIPF